MPTSNIQLKKTQWEYRNALLWSQYREADAERARILGLYTSFCCDDERSCRCDFHAFATTAERKQVEALDAICDDVQVERIALTKRIDRCRKVMAVCAMRPIHIPGVQLAAAMREMEAA
jgi:hypothetical protein